MDIVHTAPWARDGYPTQRDRGDYVVWRDPFKTSFPAAQQVSYQVYEMLRDDPGLEHCYQLDAAYEAVDRKYLLYKKIRPVDRACIDVLKQRLEALYSDTPLVYEPHYFIALSGIDDTVKYTFNIW